MIDKKRQQLIQNIQRKDNEYWLGVTIDDIITIRTGGSSGPYVQREAEEFTAIRLPNRPIPGLERTLRCIPLNRDSVTFRHVPLDWITHINGKPFQTKSEWKVKGSKGNTYTVKAVGDRFVCSCPGFKYRKKCKHSEQVKNEQ
jgi:hypothetical protein